MKIMFLSSGDQTFLPEFYEKVFDTIDKDVAGLTVVSDPHFKRFLWNSLLFMGLRLFAAEVFRQVKLRLKDNFYSIFSPSKKRTIQSVCMKFGIPFFYSEKINSEEFRSMLYELGIDLIVSVSCPQIFKKKILGLPKYGCINVHYGLLPEYRGMYPSFWVLANGETETGVSIHYMAEKVDAGDILVQIKEKIRPDDSFYSLVKRLKTTIGPKALISAIEKIRSGNFRVIKNEYKKGSYYSFPTKEAMRKFRARGRRWF